MTIESKSESQNTESDFPRELKSIVAKETFPENLVRLAIEYSIFVVLYFLLMGRHTNYENTAFFVYGITLLLVTIIPSDSVTSVLSSLKAAAGRQADHGWVTRLNAEQVTVWRTQMIFSLGFTCMGIGLIWWLMPVFGGLPLWMVLVCIFLLNLILIQGVVKLTFNRLFTQFSIPIDTCRKQTPFKPNEDSLCLTVLGLWFPGLVAASLLVVVKTADESVFVMGAHDLTDYAFSVASAAYIFGLWCFYGGQEFVKHACGFLSESIPVKYEISIPDWVFLLHLASVSVYLILFGIGFVFDAGYWLSVFICSVLVIASGCMGLVMGVIWRIPQHKTSVSKPDREGGRLKLD